MAWFDWHHWFGLVVPKKWWYNVTSGNTGISRWCHFLEAGVKSSRDTACRGKGLAGLPVSGVSLSWWGTLGNRNSLWLCLRLWTKEQRDWARTRKSYKAFPPLQITSSSWSPTPKRALPVGNSMFKHRSLWGDISLPNRSSADSPSSATQ